MKYLIDAYNLFFSTQKECIDLSKERDQFINLLNKVATECNFQAHLIFDGKEGTFFSSKQKFEKIEVSFSPNHLSADQYLLELLEWNGQTTTLVTSDQALLKKGALLGAKTFTLEEFVNLISKKQQLKQCRNKKPILSESKADFERLRVAFEKKLKKIDTGF